jgi:hypothetical protein
MARNGEGVDVRGEVVDLLFEKIASDRNPSVTMMNMVEELLAPDDIPAYAVVLLLDKVKTDRYPSHSILRRLIALASSPGWSAADTPAFLCQNPHIQPGRFTSAAVCRRRSPNPQGYVNRLARVVTFKL